MIARGSILSGPMVFGRDPEVVGQLTDLLITDRALILGQDCRNLSGIGCMDVSEDIQETS